MRFIKGVWYKYFDGNYYLKCSQDSVDTIYYSEYINIKEKKHNISSSEFLNEHVTNIEVPLLKIQEFLPPEHEDLLTELIPELKEDYSNLIKLINELNYENT